MRGCFTDKYEAWPVCSRGLRRCIPDYGDPNDFIHLIVEKHENLYPLYINEGRPFETRHLSRASRNKACHGDHWVVIRTTCKNGRLYTVIYLEREGYPRP